MPAAVAGPSSAEDGTSHAAAIGAGVSANAAYTARYYHASPAATFAPLQPRIWSFCAGCARYPTQAG